MTRLLSVVGLAWLYCTIGELQPVEYLKCVFLEILNVTTWSVFQNKVTYYDTKKSHYNTQISQYTYDNTPGISDAPIIG